jgi:hypothetical protein
MRTKIPAGNLFSINTNINTGTAREDFINLRITTGFRPQLSHTKDGVLFTVTGAEN